MKRCAGIVVALVLLPSCKARICEPWKPLGLPGITSIDSCYDSHIDGKTTATTDDFVRELEAKGFTAGREIDGTYGNQRFWVVFTKSDDPSFYKMPSNVNALGGGKSDNFFIDKKPKDTRWIPDTEWKRLATIDADRAAQVTKLAAAAQLFADTKSAPDRCDDAVLTQDPALNTPVLGAKKRSFLLDTDLHGLAGWPAEPRPYTTGAAPKPSEKPSEKLESRMISDLVFDRTELDDLAKIRMVRVLRVTSYEAPRVTSKDTGKEAPLDFFVGGRASFDVGVVDLVERKVLCRGKGEAQSSKSIKEGPTADGGYVRDPETDLRHNIDLAARAALSRMSPQLK